MLGEGTDFEWDAEKDAANIAKHGISFIEAARAFADPARLISRNVKHSVLEVRYFCIGNTGRGICTVRFTMRGDKVRIIGAGFWREGKSLYEKRASRL